VDAGNDLARAKEGMERLKIDPGRVRAVLLTHTDFDHTAAVKLFTNAKVYLSKQEEPLVTGKVHKIPFVKNRVDAPYELLNDGQELTIGSATVKAILTPGHTPGSMCYLVNNKFLFTGDDLSLINGEARLFSDFFNMDSRAEGESIKRIAKLNHVAQLFTAHYGTTANFPIALRKWRN
jgi:hydroxyacylglutathione hydrolase